MNENILSLEPKNIWKNFRELTLIPRKSKNEKKISEFLCQFGKNLNIESFLDDAGNIIWKKNASKGYENLQTVVFQAHCDMVCQKTINKNHNFDTDAITTIIKGDKVFADNTTLGADDGLGVAIIMSIFEDENLIHGPLQALITVDEETGMTGANMLKDNVLEGDILINLDSEEEGFFYIGCAGGCRCNTNTKLVKKLLPFASKSYKLSINNLKGGHSGCDIVKNRPNAIKLISRFLYKNSNLDIKISELKGGSLDNAIPRDAYAIISIDKSKENELKNAVNDFLQTLNQEYKKSDPDFTISLEEVENQKFSISPESQNKVIMLLQNICSNVFAMSGQMENLVETSSNLAIVNCNLEEMNTLSLMRSSSSSQMKYLQEVTRSLVEFTGSSIEFYGEYPGWQPNKDSKILQIAIDTYQKLFNKKATILAIHAGLECGLILSKYPKMDAISLGPTLYDVHTPSECIEIDTVEPVYKHILEILKNIPAK